MMTALLLAALAPGQIQFTPGSPFGWRPPQPPPAPVQVAAQPLPTQRPPTAPPLKEDGTRMTHGDRIAALEAKLDRIEAALARLLPDQAPASAAGRPAAVTAAVAYSEVYRRAAAGESIVVGVRVNPGADDPTAVRTDDAPATMADGLYLFYRAPDGRPWTRYLGFAKPPAAVAGGAAERVLIPATMTAAGQMPAVYVTRAARRG